MNAPRSGPMVIAPDQLLAGHVATALEVHRRSMRSNGVTVPAQFDELTEIFIARARQGQPGTEVAAPFGVSETPHVERKTVTYAQAAQTLGCSVRQIKRLTASGQLAKILIGGLVRIRIVDLDEYLARADQQRETG